MQGHRIERVSQMIQEKLGILLLRRVKDPAVQGVTITEVRVSGDLAVAKVWFAASDDDLDRVRDGLKRVAPYLRRELGTSLRIKRTPELRFYRDEAVETAGRVESILRDLDAGEVGEEP